MPYTFLKVRRKTISIEEHDLTPQFINILYVIIIIFKSCCRPLVLCLCTLKRELLSPARVLEPRLRDRVIAIKVQWHLEISGVWRGRVCFSLKWRRKRMHHQTLSICPCLACIWPTGNKQRCCKDRFSPTASKWVKASLSVSSLLSSPSIFLAFNMELSFYLRQYRVTRNCFWLFPVLTL